MSLSVVVATHAELLQYFPETVFYELKARNQLYTSLSTLQNPCCNGVPSANRTLLFVRNQYILKYFVFLNTLNIAKQAHTVLI